MELIKKKTGEPFADERAAKLRAGVIRKTEGKATEVVEVEGGFALRVINAQDKSAKLAKRRLLRSKRRDRFEVKGKDPNFAYRWVNDREDLRRISDLQDIGYEIDTSGTEAPDEDAGKASALGSAKTQPVGGGTTGVLMRIPKDLYEEYQLEAEGERLEQEEAIENEPNQEGNFGNIRIGASARP